MKLMKKITLFAFLLVSLLGLTHKLNAQHNASWGRPPDGWDDFYLGLVNDYKNTNAVGETGYWLDVTNKANGLSTYNAADPIKKSVLYQYKYINAGVDTATNWNSQKSLVPYGLNLLPSMRYDADQVGMRCAWVIYMMQEDAGAVAAKNNIANLTWLKNYFLNIKYVAQTGAGKKEIFIIEPDLFGYISENLYNSGTAATGISPSGVGLGMTAPMATVAADPNYSYLAGLPNNFEGVIQGVIRTIRLYNPQAYCGVCVNLWGAWTPTNIPPAPAKSGLVWWNAAQINAAATYQSTFFQGLLNDVGYDKGDFLVPEKNGFPAYLAVGGQQHWMWGDQQMQNYLSFFETLGKSVCLPLVAWQVSLGQSSNAAGFGITLTSPPGAAYTLSNASQGYEDTFVQYMFNNINGFINAGFIGFLGGKGMPTGTDYSLKTGFGDRGFFFDKARTVVDPGRPWNLNRGAPIPDLGNDTTLCGTGGSIILNPGNMGASPILWSTGATTTTISVNSAGTYWIRVGGASECQRRDTIVVSNTFVVNLGNDQNLCSAGSITLDAGHQETSVTYVWKKNGSVLTLDITRYLTVSSPGTYRVEVTDPSCLPMKADDIIITSNALSTNTGVCVNFPSTATLTVSNTGGTYKWYTSATGGAAVFTVSSFTTPSLSTETTYYVADEALYNTSIIPKTVANGFTNSPGNGNPQATTDNDWLYFDVAKDIQLVSLTIEAILYYSPGTRSAAIIISNPSTGFSYTSAPEIVYATPVVGSGPTIVSGVLTPLTPISIPAGTGYRIRIDNAAGYVFNYFKGNSSNIIQPRNYNGLITTTGYACAVGCAIAGMPAIYDWVIKASSICARTPVTVRSCGTLPVDFISFTVKKEQGQNKLHWLIASTKEVGEFQIERSSDGISFERIYSEIIVNGANYYAYDNNSLTGNSYYRIKQIDSDGSFIYSSIVMVSSTSEPLQINVYPNPSHDEFTVTLYSEEKSSLVSLALYNTMGQRVIEKQILVTNESEFMIDNTLPKGIYILKIKNQLTEYTFKLIKE